MAQKKEDSKKVVYAGIVKERFWDNEPWSLRAAFKEVRGDGTERLTFCGAAKELDENSINETGSIPRLFNLSSDEAERGIKAITQAEKDISSGKASLDDIPAWDELTIPDRIAAMYQP